MVRPQPRAVMPPATCSISISDAAHSRWGARCLATWLRATSGRAGATADAGSPAAAQVWPAAQVLCMATAHDAQLRPSRAVTTRAPQTAQFCPTTCSAGPAGYVVVRPRAIKILPERTSSTIW